MQNGVTNVEDILGKQLKPQKDPRAKEKEFRDNKMLANKHKKGDTSTDKGLVIDTSKDPLYANNDLEPANEHTE